MKNYVKTFEDFTNKKHQKNPAKMKNLTSYEEVQADEEDKIRQQQDMAQRGAKILNIETRP